MILERMGLEPEAYYEPEDFQFIFEYNTPETISILGNAAASISDMILQTIGREIKNLDRQKFFDKQRKREDNKTNKSERSATHGDRIQDRRGLSDTRSEIGRNGGDLRKVRYDTQDIPQKPQNGDVSEPAASRQADSAFGGDRSDSEHRWNRSTQLLKASRLRTKLRIRWAGWLIWTVWRHRRRNWWPGNWFTNNAAKIISEKAEDTASAEQSPFLPSMGICHSRPLMKPHLGSNFEDSKLRICYQYKRNRPPAENVAFLKDEYKTGGKGYISGYTCFRGFQSTAYILARVRALYTRKHPDDVGTGRQEDTELFEWGYMPQSELDKVDAYITKSLLNPSGTFTGIFRRLRIWFDTEIFHGDFVHTERIAEMLESPRSLRKSVIFKRLCGLWKTGMSCGSIIISRNTF